MPLYFGGSGVTPSLNGYTTNEITLPAGACYELPNNWFQIRAGKYTTVQEYDPISGTYRVPGAGATFGGSAYVKGDGNNVRLANQTGCVVGALVTNGGTGYTSAPAVTAASGNAIFRAIVGGAVNTSITVTNGGQNYTYPPIVLFAAPPAGGVCATGTATLTSGAVTSVTVTDQGAGYNAPPVITFLNDPREGVNGVTTGFNAAAVCVLTGAGTVTQIVTVDHGSPVSGGTVPVLTISGGGGTGAAATAICCLTITAYTVSSTTTGSGYAAPVIIQAYGGFPATSPAYTNPTFQSQLVRGRTATIIGAVSGTALTATGQVVNDGGIYPGVPTTYTYGGIQGAGAVAAVLGLTMGGVSDTSIVLTT